MTAQNEQPSAGIIQVQGLEAAYEGRTVLRDISFDVRRGEVLIIAGGSGSGKSTLLKQMIGLNAPAKGRVLIEGEDIHAVHGRQREQLLRRFGVAYQGGALFGSMTVLENVRLPLEEFTDLAPEMMGLIALAKLRLVNLEEAGRKMPSELSGGMQKRAAIARALALDPPIVFLDEPSAGLDPITSAGLDQLILNLKRMLGATFVVVSHELGSIFAIADRVVMLDAASRTVIEVGEPARLRDESPHPQVRAFFNRQAMEATSAGNEGAGRPPSSGSNP